MERLEINWDVFISHASEDKESFVRPLAFALVRLGVSVWYDDFSLRPGDSLSRSIDKGLAQSRYGIVVISPNFIKKRWPEYELRGLVSRELNGGKVIIPIWHEINRNDILKFSPPLADKVAINTESAETHDIAIQLLREINPDLYFKHPVSELQKIASGLAFQELKKEFELTIDGIIAAFVRIIESRDPYRFSHQHRVAKLSCAIAQEMGYSQEQIKGIQFAGSIHDIGTLSVPGEILAKPSRLNNIEIAIIKIHPRVGFDILGDINFPWPLSQTILQHHERLNGSGYPQGITGKDMINEAKIIAVADVVEAMSSHRPYRPALGIDRALEEIERNRGILYDPDVVDICIKLFNKRWSWE